MRQLCFFHYRQDQAIDDGHAIRHDKVTTESDMML
jgi:hypothetical protein